MCASQVTYLMLNIWPKTMALEGRKSCAETLRMVADFGYTMHELAMSPAVWDDTANRIIKVPRLSRLLVPKGVTMAWWYRACEGKDPIRHLMLSGTLP